MIETERLVLRGYWVANVKDRAQSDVMMDRLNAHIAAHGYGLWGVARKTDDKIIGFCGLDPIAEGDLPVGPGVEMAWRMIPEVWRQGLASEAAAAGPGPPGRARDPGLHRRHQPGVPGRHAAHRHAGRSGPRLRPPASGGRSSAAAPRRLCGAKMRIETDRLIVRLWRVEDLEPFAQMSADPEVMQWLGGVLTREQVEAYKVRADTSFAELGMCRMVIERRADGAFVGSCGLMPGHESVPFVPYTDVGWRLARSAWGQGYASEAAAAVMADGFARLGLDEITAITAQINVRSQAVMQRLGMRRDAASDFDHPAFEPDDPMRRTVVYRMRR